MVKLDKYIERKVECGCGSHIYKATIEYKGEGQFVHVWECGNCMKQTPRQSRSRKSNAHKAFEVWQQLNNEWAPVNEKLHNGAYGTYLLHNSHDNYHMRQLLNAIHAEFDQHKRMSHFDLHYHTHNAKQALEAAKAAVEGK